MTQATSGLHQPASKSLPHKMIEAKGRAYASQMPVQGGKGAL
jgi:hypothetical protein